MPPPSVTAPAAVPRPLLLPSGDHCVLLFHGLSSSPLELQFLARGLHRQGYSVRVPVLKGYTNGLVAEVPVTAQDWVSSALSELDEALKQYRRVSIGGLCLGAVLALRVAELRDQDVASVMALSTALHYDGWGNPWFTPLLPLARYLPFARRIRVRERWPYGLKDERMRAWVAKQMQKVGDSDAGAATLQVGELLKARDLIAMVQGDLRTITAPILLIHAKEDECATPRSAFDVARGVQSNNIRCILLDDSYHMISIDREKERVLSEMCQFLPRVERGVQHDAGDQRPKVVPLFEGRHG